ncbi:MAG: twin-arginine translocase subunit TatC [Muribaculaceae bacterium]|nr:twin-arginine translocase subunit TatC [Muribaculaceae bacterium]
MPASSNAGFWDHVDALRSVLLKVAAVVAIIGVGAFLVMPWAFDHVIMAPCEPGFVTYRFFDALGSRFGADPTPPDFHVDVVSLELASQIFVHFSAACWTALIVGFPIILYILWGFVAPALYEHERRGIRRNFVFGNIMFYLGVATGYFLVFPLCVRFLADYQLSSTIRPIVSLDSYMDNFFTLLLLMGAVFELPVVAWLLGKAGILNRGFFNTYRRHAIVALLVVAALITPTGDPFTLLVVFIPIYALWEMSSRLVPPPPPSEP